MADSISYASRMSDSTSLLDMWREHRNEGIENSAPFWDKARDLKRFAARIQWPDPKKSDDPNRPHARITVPETSRIIAFFSGRQILQRLEREYIPRNQDTARWAEILTKVDSAICQACDGEQVDSAAFRDGPGIQGVSWVRWYIDDWSGPKPQLKFETVPIWQMMWPATRLLNLQDRAWHRWGSWWPQSRVRARWPDHYDKIRSLIGTSQWSSVQQTVKQHSRIPWTGGAGNRPLSTADSYDPYGRCFWIEQEEYRELETYFEVAKPVDPNMSYAEALDLDRQRIPFLADPTTAEQAPPDPFETQEMSVDEVRAYRKERLAVHGEDVPNDMMPRKQRLAYRYIYGCGDEILETGDIEQGVFTFQAMAAEVVELEDKTLYISLMEDMRDAQRMVNYMMSALVRDIQVNPKGVFIYERGLFRDPNEAKVAWASPGGAIEVDRGRMGQSGNRPWEIVAGGTQNYSSKLEAMLAFYREALTRLAAVNPAALGQLGQDIRRVSGEVVRQLTDATMTGNAERMDSFRLYRREGARILLAFARTLWEPGDLVDFIGESDAFDEVLDPETLMPTGEKVLAIPPKEAWSESYWKEIAIGEVQPSDSELTAFWDTVQTQVALLQSPMPDTGQPLFQAEDWVKMFPKMPASLRQKMLARIKLQQRKLQQQQMQQAQAEAQGGAEMPPNGSGGGEQAPMQ